MSSRRFDLLPYGAHTYSKSDARWWSGAPVIVEGKGGMCWDVAGRPYVDWSGGINNVLIGHAEDAIDDAAVAALRRGQAFGRPSLLEEQAAEAVLSLFPQAEQIIFTKSGSSANDAAIKLARAVTGRQHIAFDGTAPFFSTSDWWCAHQSLWSGTLDAERSYALPFRFNDVDSLSRCFEQRPLAAVILEACRGERPTPAFLQALTDLCRADGTLLICDEVVTGYRYGLHGAAALFGLEPDLMTLGKGMSNGYSVAALLGKREYMSRGASDVFLLSTTNGAESSGLAAAIATVQFYRDHDVIGRLADVGSALGGMVKHEAARAGAAVRVQGDFTCRPLITVAPDAKDRFYRTLCEHGVLIPPNWCCPCYRRTKVEMEVTHVAMRLACEALMQQSSPV